MDYKSMVFPCKSINLLRFLKLKGLKSEHKYTDAKDMKDCWIFIRNASLNMALEEWKILKQKSNI